MHALQYGQNDQTGAFVVQPAMQHKDVLLDLLKCRYPLS
jgi:hypothetical protein